MRSFALGAAAALALATAMPAVAVDTAADAQFEAIYTKEWAWRILQDPAGEDHTTLYGPTLPDVSPAAQEKRVQTWTAVKRQLAAIPRASLSPRRQVDYDVYRFQIDARLAQQNFREYEKPLSSDGAFWNDFSFVAHSAFRREVDYRNWIGQMRDIPRYFAQQTANMRAGLKRGFTPPRITLEGREASIAAVANAATPEDNIFYLPFVTMPPDMPAATQAALRAEARAAITDAVVPTYRSFLNFYRDEYVPATRTTLAASDMPGGKPYYQSLITEFATVDMTPDQIHDFGLAEGLKIRAEMMAAMQQTGFKGELPAFLNELRTNKRFYATTEAQLLREAAWISKEIDSKIGNYIGHLPRRRFGIREMPAEIAPKAAAARGGPDGFLVNVYALETRPLFALRSLALHEGAPGHSMQIPLAMENTESPEFRRQTSIAAYEEGWGLYSERLGVEMGIYPTPYDIFGMLSMQAWRAARLVVDSGIHAKGWSRKQAQDYLRVNTTLADHEIETEVDRYIARPGQALSYYLGMDAIQKARTKAQTALGPKFNLRAFHDAVLALGSVPMPVLAAQIDQFIAGGGVGPYPDEEK
ncbi:DUF885 domain-containing protein [Sandarakinorhabdus sp.]|uniref:DUF885 domain-containing protein n=1 Tax=Sandarakinorhabdus sp. TaxID=1916663 RepID=UPI003F6F24C0